MSTMPKTLLLKFVYGSNGELCRSDGDKIGARQLRDQLDDDNEKTGRKVDVAAHVIDRPRDKAIEEAHAQMQGSAPAQRVGRADSGQLPFKNEKNPKGGLHNVDVRSFVEELLTKSYRIVMGRHLRRPQRYSANHKDVLGGQAVAGNFIPNTFQHSLEFTFARGSGEAPQKDIEDNLKIFLAGKVAVEMFVWSNQASDNPDTLNVGGAGFRQLDPERTHMRLHLDTRRPLAYGYEVVSPPKK